jgi:hypothetical protein
MTARDRWCSDGTIRMMDAAIFPKTPQDRASVPLRFTAQDILP